MKDKKFTYNEMLEQVPDYIFGRLRLEEKTIFEENLQKYPEIVKEITDAQEVFKRFDSISFDKLIDRKTRNLSVGVNRRLNKSKNSRTSFVYRLAIPMLALVLFLIFIYTNGRNNNDLDTTTTISKPLLDLSPKDALSIIDENVNANDVISANSNVVSFVYNRDELSNLIKTDEYGLNDLILDEIFKHYSSKELESIANSTDSDELMEIVKDLDENDLQIILKGIENAKIIS